MQLPYQSNHYKNSNPFYIRFIQYINQKYNQSFEIDVVDKKLPELIDKNHFEIIKNHKEHSFNIRESEEYFVFWMIELIKEYHLDSKMCTNDEIYNIIKIHNLPLCSLVVQEPYSYLYRYRKLRNFYTSRRHVCG